MSAAVAWASRPGLAGVKLLVELPPAPVVERRVVNVHDLIACPTCRCRVDETCKTASGHTTTPHGSRLAPRLCPCGALVDYRHRYCEPCAKRAIQASKNEHARLRRQAARARYA